MNFQDAGQKTLSEISTIVDAVIRRYWRAAIAPALAVLAIGVFVAVRLPDYFTADVLIFIQPQRLASKLIETPDKDDMRERLEALVQEILSRGRLRNVIKRYDLYPNALSPLQREQAVLDFKGSLLISPAISPTGGKLLQTFQLAYTNNDARKAFEVTKAISDLFIEESIISRRSEIQGTEEFIQSQLVGARKELEQTEARVQKFIGENFDKLPEHLEATVARLQTSQQQLATNSQMISAEETRLSNLRSELKEVQRSAVGAAALDIGSASDIDPFDSLAQLESALVVLSSKYSERHPDVINTRKRIEALRSQLNKGGAGKKPASAAPRKFRGPNAGVLRSLRREINEREVRITTLKKENERLRAQIDKFSANIETMPLKEQELIKIRRDYANVQGNYERLLAAKEDAELQSSLVRSQRGAQFRVVEPAELPIKPAGPHRGIILSASIALSILIFVGVPTLLYFLNGSFKSSKDVEAELELDVLGVIPPMETREAKLQSRKTFATSVVGSAVSVAVGCLFILLAL